MPKIPFPAGREFVSGLTMVSRGKVRDTYALPDSSTLLPVATDRVSIFDFVLPAEVPQKGEVLTAMNIFWALQLANHTLQDVIAFGRDIDNHHLPERHRGNTELQRRAMVVKKLDMIPVEAITRGYLTGSGWNAYAETAPNHVICGHPILKGLVDGDCLPSAIFTPTTKAEEGHDEHMGFEEVRARFGAGIEAASLQLFELASKIALERGIIIADTKLEFGINPKTGQLVLGDERFTPDASRFWLLEDWRRSRATGTSPISFDKQFVRNWGKTVGIDKLDPLCREDVEQVHRLVVPQDVLAKTAHLYRYIFYLITGMRLEAFQRSKMEIAQTVLPPVEVVLGSESDLPYARRGLDLLCAKPVPCRLHIISCHRNPETLRRYAESMVPHNATVIAAAGKAAALPGMLQAWLNHYRKGHIPVLGVALGENGADDFLAARFSIEKLPGNPVVLRTKDEAYRGSEGFKLACEDAATMEFFVPNVPSKEPRLGLMANNVNLSAV